MDFAGAGEEQRTSPFILEYKIYLSTANVQGNFIDALSAFSSDVLSWFKPPLKLVTFPAAGFLAVQELSNMSVPPCTHSSLWFTGG